MKTQEPNSPEAFQTQYGLEPQMVENLVESQRDYLKEYGWTMTLEEVYLLEIGQHPSEYQEP